ncbi:MAG: recombination protein RecR [Armatimonadetes bacterium]|nr:recombination protein RecR [Candidatus Hippobium faecium]
MITYYPKPLAKLVNRLSGFPGVGQKSAQRMAFYIMSLPMEEARDLCDSIMDVKQNIKECRICHNFSSEEVCEICSAHDRKQNQICVVAEVKDIISMEKTNEYHGLYHVLGGVIDPFNKKGPENLNIKDLVQRVAGGNIEEVIIAVNPTVEGDTTALYIAGLLKNFVQKITRIGYGLPVGADMDYTDQATMIKAFQARNEI